MKGEIRASISAAAAAAMLIACASKEPASPRSTDASASAQDDTAAEYQRLADNANHQLVCKKQTVLGTRVPTVVCVTQEELKAQQERSDEAMHDIQANTSMRQVTTDRPAPPPSPSPRP